MLTGAVIMQVSGAGNPKNSNIKVKAATLVATESTIVIFAAGLSISKAAAAGFVWSLRRAGVVVLGFIWRRQAASRGRLDELKRSAQRRKAGRNALKNPTHDPHAGKGHSGAGQTPQPKNEAELGKLKTSWPTPASATRRPSVFSWAEVRRTGRGPVVRRRHRSRRSGRQPKLADLVDRPGRHVFYLPDLIVGSSAAAASRPSSWPCPTCFDLMVVCVEAGLGLDQAMRKVAEEMKKTYASWPRSSRCPTSSCRWAGPAPRCSTNSAREPAWRPAGVGGRAHPGR